jgi:hypothetical protein
VAQTRVRGRPAGRGPLQPQAGDELLPDHGDPAPQDRARVARHRPAVEQDVSVVGDHVTGDAADERRLARPVLTGQRHQLTRLEAQVDAVERPQRAEPGGKTTDGQQRSVPGHRVKWRGSDRSGSPE